jgi:RimJ/RimL family protein N-acetyltransferase
MTDVTLRPLRASDISLLEASGDPADDAFGFFGHRASNGLARRFAENGGISDDLGNLVVVPESGDVAGTVSWFAVHHGPGAIARALNIGISLLPAFRGRGYGTIAQARFAEYLFAATLIERLEASTDVENIAEQRALEKAGFTREGILRHAQFRAGAWRDTVLYSRLRGD